MEMLVKGYKSKGDKVLSNFEQLHSKQSSDVHKGVQRKNNEVADSLRGASEVVGEMAQDSGDALAAFEKNWIKQQNQAQDRISRGMDKCA